MWVLTEEYNDYDQHGAYFLHAWTKKPSAEAVKKALFTHGHTWDDESVARALAGGGRQGVEYSWVNLFEFTG